MREGWIYSKLPSISFMILKENFSDAFQDD